jgi:hypothetical protein
MNARQPISSWSDLLREVAAASIAGAPRRRKKSAAGSICSVYFIQGATTGRIKIGESMNVPERLRALQSAASETLELLLVIRNSRDSTYHKRFRKERVKGEWHSSSARLLDFIRSRKQKARTASRQS